MHLLSHGRGGRPGRRHRRLVQCLRRKTPRAIIGLLNRHLNSILQEPEARAASLAQGCDPAGGSPEDFHRVLADEVVTWSRVIHAADIKFEQELLDRLSLTLVRSRCLSPVSPHQKKGKNK